MPKYEFITYSFQILRIKYLKLIPKKIAHAYVHF